MFRTLFSLAGSISVSRATRSRWLKDPLLPEPDLVAGGVCYFTDEKLDLFDRLRTERERAKRTVKAQKEQTASAGADCADQEQGRQSGGVRALRANIAKAHRRRPRCRGGAAGNSIKAC